MQDLKKEYRRIQFLKKCSESTKTIHLPILNLYDVNGALNPGRLGQADKFSYVQEGGQSSVGFDSVDEYRRANKSGTSSYANAAEYGIVRTSAAAAVCQKMADLHGGVGAIICPSGLAAITTVLGKFSPTALAIPDNVYYPLVRYAEERNPSIKLFRYSADASRQELETLIETAAKANSPIEMIYLEAPCSGTFEIADIDGIAALAKEKGIRSVMDNTWGTHIRFQPIKHGIDIVIQATTKYESGYSDNPSGIVIAGNQADLCQLSRATRVLGIGAVATETCARLFHRVDSTEERLNQHFNSAQQLIAWFKDQHFVADVLSPATIGLAHNRFNKYFGGKGNGLFTVRFKEGISAEQIDTFIDELNLFRIAESWGSHVSLVLPVYPSRGSSLSNGTMFRFHAGLEDPLDLIRDLNTAARHTLSVRPSASHSLHRSTYWIK